MITRTPPATVEGSQTPPLLRTGRGGRRLREQAPEEGADWDRPPRQEPVRALDPAQQSVGHEALPK